MVFRVLVAATLCLVASAAALAADASGDLPLVLGEAGVVADSVVVAPTGDAEAEVVPTEVVPTEAEPVAGVPGDDWPLASEEPVSWAASGVSCVDAPATWAAFTTVDAVFIERSNGVGPLAVENQVTSDPGVPVITAGDVRYPVTPGVRIFQGWRGPDCRGYEIGYLGIWGMYADAQATSPTGSLAVPGQLGVIPGSGFDAASAIRPALRGTLNSLEFNILQTMYYDGCQRHDPLPWRRVGIVPTADWILGIRWAGLDETATLDVSALGSTPPPVFHTTGYRVTSSSQLVGPQIGYRRRIEWGDWTLEGWAKAAVVGSFLSQSQSAVVGPFDLVQIRGPRSSTANQVGMIGDVNATLVRRFGDHWGLRAGYTLLWLSGVAPAANQWDFTNTSTSGTRLVSDTVFLHGATLGVEAAW